MSEIEKMYKNAGIKKKRYCEYDSDNCPYMFGHLCSDCGVEMKPEKYLYPPFTAEKQIELIKWLGKRCFYIEISEMMNKSYGIAFKYQPTDEYKNEQSECCVNKNFTEALAESINYIWQDLTEEERTQIKEILE